MTTSANFSLPRLALCALLFSARLIAQSAQPTDPETIKLSAFEVKTEANRGYTAAETMSGSRVKTQIADLPYTVNVLTSEFFSDFGIFTLSDNVTQIGNFTGLDIGGNFNLRGFSSSNQLRDGFFRLGRYGSSNIDRMEIIKGSNAAIYGRTSPGGMVNFISKQPKAEEKQTLLYNYGDYGTQRVTLESTGPLLKGVSGRTNYVLTASHYQRKFDQAYATDRNQEYYLAVDHVFADGSKVFVSIEYFLQLRHAPLAAIPLVIDQKGTAATTDDVAIGYALNLGKYNAFGPVTELNRGNISYTAIYEKKLNSIFSARVSANNSRARRWDYNYNTAWGSVSINPPVATTAISSLRGATPNRGRIYEDTGGFQADLLAEYRTLDQKIDHRTLITFDLNDYYRWDPTRSYAGATDPDIIAWSAARRVILDANFNPIGPIAYFPKRSQESPGEVQTRNTKRHTTVMGGLIRHQSALFQGRLLAFAGIRYDLVRYRHHDNLASATANTADYALFKSYDPTYTTGKLIAKEFSQLKPNTGVNYKITSNLRAYASYSQSFFVAQGDNPVDIADPTYKSERADGYDYGFKGSFLNERLNYTVSGFYARRENVSVTDLVETPQGSGNYVTTTRRDGNQLVRGFEGDLNWLMTDELSFLASYGHVHTIYTDYGTAFPAAIGRSVTFMPPYNGSVSLKYSPRRGSLKGFSANVGVTFVGSTPTELPNAGDVYTTTSAGKRVVTSSTGQWSLRAPSYNLWSFGARYALAARSNYMHTFAVNMNNVFNKQYLRAGASNATRLLGENRAVFFTYTLSHKGSKF